MTRSSRGGSLLFPLALLFLGIMFLLINLGVVAPSAWSQIVRFWPAFLILLGIDTLLQRRSAGAVVGAFVGALALIAVGLMAFHLFAPEAWVSEQHAFSHAVQDASRADIILSCRDCAMALAAQPSPADVTTLLSGTVAVRRTDLFTESVRRVGDGVHIRLGSQPRFPVALPTASSSNTWLIGLNGEIPLSLSLTTSGAIDLDLSRLRVGSVDITAGKERCTVYLSGRVDAALYLVVEDVELITPSDLGVRVIGTAEQLSVPPGYQETEDGMQSAGYANAEIRYQVHLRPGCERIEIRVSNEPSAST